MRNLKEMSEEDLLAYWGETTEEAERTDDWQEVIRIEQELLRRGIHPEPWE